MNIISTTELIMKELQKQIQTENVQKEFYNLHLMESLFVSGLVLLNVEEMVMFLVMLLLVVVESYLIIKVSNGVMHKE